MNVCINIELQPWATPNFVRAKMSPRPKQEGVNLESPSWPLWEVDALTLSQMCDEFRAEVFKKAGKEDPHPFSCK